jgi:opacity protein-like surface antigen
MKRWVLFCVVTLLFAGVLSAQGTDTDAPKVEVFGGYSYLRFNPGMGVSGVNFNGGSGSIAYNLTPSIGIVGDIGGYHYSQSGGTANVISYLFGPKIAMRRGPITPFAQVLFGGAHGSLNGGTCAGARVRPEGTIVSGCGSTSENAFAMALGGGVDWNATDHIGIRLIQAEYLLTRFGFGGPTYSQNNARISAGVVFRF